MIYAFEYLAPPRIMEVKSKINHHSISMQEISDNPMS